MIRIKDIADRVGVSTATVSNVIHGKQQRVSPEVRKKIEEALDEMGYVPNMSAMMLAQNDSRMIGVVIPRKEAVRISLDDPYYSALVGFLDLEIRKQKHYMYLILQQDEDSILKQASAWNLEGLIVCNMEEKPLLRLHERYRGYMVSLDAYLDRQTDFINIMTDDYDGGYQMGKYLYAKGHRRIAMVADNDYGVDHHRWLGLRAALAECGVQLEEKDHLCFYSAESTRSLEFERLYPRFLQYTALFVASDLFALEVSSFLQGKGIRVPEQISITGFDDLLYARLARPMLTTMHQNIEKKAEMAVQALLQIKEKKAVSDQWVLAVSLVERESVRQLDRNP